MSHLTIDRRLLAVLGLFAIICACPGCSLLDTAAKKSIANRPALPEPTTANAPDLVERPPGSKSRIELTASSSETEAERQGEDSLAPGSLPRETDDVLAISLTDAITTALSNNLHLRVIENLPEEVGKRAEIERAQFDTSLNTNAQYLQGTQQVASALQAVQGGMSQYGTTAFGPVSGSPNLMSVEKRFSTGTTARVGLGSTYNFTSPIGQYLIYNPAYQSAASLVVEQALFRGASREANLSGIQIAQTNQQQSAAEFQTEVNQTLSDVQRAYWMAWLAESQLKTSQEFVEQAQAAHALEQRRFELGDGGVVQSAQTAENLYSLKAELAQAQQRSRAARNRLLTLMGVSPGDQRVLKMKDEPLAEAVMLDLQQGLAVATQQRPEIQVRQLQVSQAQLELDRRKNSERPDVRAYAGYSLMGLNNNLTGSLGQFGSGQFGTMSLGVRYNYMFGQRAERAATDQAHLALVRQIRAREETEYLIQQQVRDAVDAVNSSWEVLKCQQERVTAARVQAETFSRLQAVGQIDLDRLIRARQQLSNALQQSHGALIEYNLALNSWRFATGTMLVPLTPAEHRPSAVASSNTVDQPLPTDRLLPTDDSEDQLPGDATRQRDEP